MDEIVKQAMAKWPNVPHCYGWLALDRRGNWRIRDERMQALQQPGERITHPALLGFINRNYTQDTQGRYYFQNGPQRVYVNLDATPYIAHTDPAQGFILHTGAPFTGIEQAWFTEKGALILQNTAAIAMVDDRDTAQCIDSLYMNDSPITDEQLLDWIVQSDDTPMLTLHHHGKQIIVRHITLAALAAQSGFVQTPTPDAPAPLRNIESG